MVVTVSLTLLGCEIMEATLIMIILIVNQLRNVIASLSMVKNIMVKGMHLQQYGYIKHLGPGFLGSIFICH